MLDFIKKNIFICVIFIVTLSVGLLTFLTFINKSFLELNQNTLQSLLISNVVLLLIFFVLIYLEIKNSLKVGAILTDVGSVKKKIIQLIEKNIPNNVSWISSHPIAGTEESGPESGFSELFKNRWCILTPSKKTKNKDIKLLKKFWEKLGSVVDVMDAKKHDYILTITSHMPHLIAYNIVNTTLKIKNKKDRNIVKYSAGGLRDFTRIAASNPIMWRDIFIQNRENTSKMIDKFIVNLKDLKKAIKSKNEKKLEKIFSETKKIRKEIIEAGQDINKPDFGRK